MSDRHLPDTTHEHPTEKWQVVRLPCGCTGEACVWKPWGLSSPENSQFLRYRVFSEICGPHGYQHWLARSNRFPEGRLLRAPLVPSQPSEIPEAVVVWACSGELVEASDLELLKKLHQCFTAARNLVWQKTADAAKHLEERSEIEYLERAGWKRTPATVTHKEKWTAPDELRIARHAIGKPLDYYVEVGRKHAINTQRLVDEGGPQALGKKDERLQKAVIRSPRELLTGDSYLDSAHPACSPECGGQADTPHHHLIGCPAGDAVLDAVLDMARKARLR